MRIVGNRVERPLALRPTAALLEEGLRFIARSPAFGESSTYIPKGLYRFRTHAEAEEQRIACLARGIAGRGAGR
ncbi:MAG: hypothetical protein ACRET8_06715 [Burkholderiales bacterium]